MQHFHEEIGKESTSNSSQLAHQHQQGSSSSGSSSSFDININSLNSVYRTQSPTPLSYPPSQFPVYTHGPIRQQQRHQPQQSQPHNHPAISPSGLPHYYSSRSPYDYNSQTDSNQYSKSDLLAVSRPNSNSNSSSDSTTGNNMPTNNTNDNQAEKAWPCPNCGKAFAREDLLKRHMAREARAASQPVYDRQKSCKECARSKARCDLEVPSCGRCRQKNKVYAPRSGNPNVRRARELSGPDVASESASHSRHPSVNFDTPQAGPSDQGGWSQPYPSSHGHPMKADEEQIQYRDQRSFSSGSTSTLENGGGNHHMHQLPDHRNQFQHHQHQQHQQHQQHRMAADDHYYPQPPPPESYQSNYQPIQRTSSPYQHSLNAHPLPPFRHLPSTSNMDSYPTQMPPGIRMAMPPNPPNQQHHQQQQQSDDRPDIPMGIAPHLWPAGEAPSPSSLMPNNFLSSSNPQTGAGNSRQMPPPLLTGARMPGPPSGVTRPSLFTACLDLSGWLDEPVVPSPLYRMGPSFNSLGSALGSAFPQFSARPLEGRNEPSQTIKEESSASTTQTSSDTPASSSQLPQQPLQIIGPDGRPIESAPNMISAKHWWSQTNRSAPEEAEALAQISAAHFKTYPALMVLPDPTSPVPPFLNRPWIAQLRALMPRSLAVARVVLAGYNVRLPPSEGMVWESIARETKALQAGLDRTLEASDTEVWAATASLCLYLILMMMSDDTASSPNVDSSLVDDSLHTLSQLAKTLAERVSNHEEDYRPSDAQDQAGSTGMDGQNHTPSSAGGKKEETFFSWGFGETMRRTLYAAYVLLVLQRYRENALNAQFRLAGYELILDCQLPASANQFEAGKEQDWREARRQEAENLEKLNQSDPISMNGGIDRSGDDRSQETKDEIKRPQHADDTLDQLDDLQSKSSTGAPIPTPASASSFTNFVYPTMKDLIEARFRLESSSETMTAYFDQTDSFTNICLTIAFALDTELASADPNTLAMNSRT